MSARLRSTCCLVCLLLILSGGGCGGGADVSSALIDVGESNRMSPPLLESEVLRASDPKELLEMEFILSNRTAEPQSVSLAGKSCSCYGVLLDGEPWETGQSVTIAPGALRRLELDITPPKEPSEKSWSVRLLSGVAEPQEQTLTLGVRIFDDLTLEPEVLFLSRPTSPAEADVNPAGHHGAADNEQPVAHSNRMSIRRVTRNKADLINTPQFADLPSWVRIASLTTTAPPEQIASGLWQQTWDVELDWHAFSDGPSADGRASTDGPLTQPVTAVRGGVHRFQVEFNGEEGDPIRASGRIVIREEAGVIAPAMVHWGRLATDVSQTRRVVLSAGDNRPFRVTGAALVPDDASFSTGTLDDSPATNHVETEATRAVLSLASPQLHLTVAMDQQTPATRQGLVLDIVPQQAGSLTATLIIQTDHPLTPRREIQMKALVVEPSAEPSSSGGG
ncbi:MAG: hypothetical protein KF861_09745 [Planctomycetaceae bacterium]|nr:hypothetical protein [Planctomycetaceae bacterium]